MDYINSDALYEEARELAEWEDEYRKLPQYKQEARVQQIIQDLIDNKMSPLGMACSMREGTPEEWQKTLDKQEEFLKPYEAELETTICNGINEVRWFLDYDSKDLELEGRFYVFDQFAICNYDIDCSGLFATLNSKTHHGKFSGLNIDIHSGLPPISFLESLTTIFYNKAKRIEEIHGKNN